MKPRLLVVPEIPKAADAASSGVKRYLWSLFSLLQRSLAIDDVDLSSCNPDEEIVRNQEKVQAEAQGIRSVPRTKLIYRSILRKFGILRFIPGYLKELIGTYRQIRAKGDGFDLIHVNRVGCEVQPIAARLAGIRPVVTTVHNLPGTDAAAQHWFRRWVEKLSFAAADLHICVSEATYQAWQKRIGLKRDRCLVVLNGVQESSVAINRQEARRLLEVAEDVVAVGILARIHPMKGHEVLFYAWKQLIEKSTVNCKLYVIGDGPIRKSLQEQVERMGLAETIAFLGHREDGPELLWGIDIAVLPSIMLETFGYSISEAMFAGIPSVVSDMGGMKEYILPSEGGKVVTAGDPDALADALLAYIDNPELRKNDGQKAREYALANLTAERMAKETLKAYAMACEIVERHDIAKAFNDITIPSR